jgi:hypothetical protein
MLEVQRDRAWHDIITLDESWFYIVRIMNSFSYHEMKKFQKENDTQFNRKNACSRSFGIRAGSI